MDSYPDNSSHAASSDPANTLTKLRGFRPLSRLEELLPTFSSSERLILYILTAVLAVSALVLLTGANAQVSVIVPASGGSLTEGVVGTARFINPLLALSESDRGLTLLTYSGLTRARADGSIIPDLASSYKISEDGTTYTFTLRPDIIFHNGTPITSSDVMFTVQMAQNPDIRSPHRADWEGVSVSTPDLTTVVFTLPRPYAPFLENTTLGILPAHLWQNISTEEFSFSSLNTKPVGSGPYQIKEVTTDKTGAITRYELAPFKNFTLGTPYLKKLTFLFFPNENTLIDAWNAGRIDSFAGISPSELARLNRNANIIRASLPRIFGVFLNQDHAPILADPAVRSALDAAIDKQKIVDSVLGGYATVLDSPIPPSILPEKNDGTASVSPEVDLVEYKERVADILERGGWKFESPADLSAKASEQEETSTSTIKKKPTWRKKGKELTFTLATADSPELVATAEALVTMWQTAGINADLHVYSLSELNTSIIRPRAYDALLFGEVVGRTLDLFAFWHSSQRNDPGLNLAMYTNARADSFLAQARTTTNRKERETLYRSFVEIIKKEKPAVFLYAPQLIYVLPETILGTEFGVLATSAERFLNVYEWYTSTERVWSVFTSVSE